MTRQKIGLVLFWIGLAWAILWGLVIGPIFVSPALRNLTTDQLNQTVWALNGPWFLIWGLFGVPLGALIAGFGMLLNSGTAGSTVWKYGAGLVLGFILGIAGMFLGHIPLLFGIGGTLILLSFLGILWFWAEGRRALTNSSAAATAADLQMMGYVFMVIAAWFTCGAVGTPFLLAVQGLPPSSPLHIMIFLALGWVFLFLSHYKSRKQENSDGT